MQSTDTALHTSNDPRLRAMVSESLQMLEELNSLTARLADASRPTRATAKSGEDMSQMEADLKSLQDRLSGLTEQVKQTAKQVDSNIRQNPYVFAAAALGLGFLLGKAKRL